MSAYEDYIEYYKGSDNKELAANLGAAYEDLIHTAAKHKGVQLSFRSKEELPERISALLKVAEERMGKNITPAEKGKFFTDRLTGNDAKLADLEAKTFAVLKAFPGTKKGFVESVEQWRQDKDFIYNTTDGTRLALPPFPDIAAESYPQHLEDRVNLMQLIEEERQKDTSLKQSKEEKLEDIYKRDRRDKKPVWGSKPNGEPIEEIIKNIEEERQKDASLKQTEKFDNKEALDQNKKQEEEDEEKKNRPQTFRNPIKGCYDAMRDAKKNGKGFLGQFAAGLAYFLDAPKTLDEWKDMFKEIKGSFKEMKQDFTRLINPAKTVAEACEITGDSRLSLKFGSNMEIVEKALDRMGFKYTKGTIPVRQKDGTFLLTSHITADNGGYITAKGSIPLDKEQQQKNEKVMEKIRQAQTKLEEQKRAKERQEEWRKDFEMCRPRSKGLRERMLDAKRNGKGYWGIVAAGLGYFFGTPAEWKESFKYMKQDFAGLINPAKAIAKTCDITQDGGIVIKDAKDKFFVKNTLRSMGLSFNESTIPVRQKDGTFQMAFYITADNVFTADQLARGWSQQKNEKIIEKILNAQEKLEGKNTAKTDNAKTNNTGYKKADFSNSTRPNSMGNEQTSANSLRDGFNALNERFGQKGKSTTPMPNTKQNSNTKQAPINSAAFNAAAAKKGQRI